MVDRKAWAAKSQIVLPVSALLGLLTSELGVRAVIGVPILVWMLSFMALGLVMAAIDKGRLMLIGALLCIMAFVIVAATPVSSALVSRWVRSDRIDPTATTVVVTSGGVLSTGVLNSHSTSRLLEGLKLARAKDLQLFTTRDAGAVEVQFGDADRSSLVQMAGRDRAWIASGPASSTRVEALLAREQLQHRGVRHVVLVTSPIHTRRACAAFERVGFTVDCVPAHERAFAAESPRSADDRLSAFRELLYEYVGTAVYRWRGWASAGGSGNEQVGTSLPAYTPLDLRGRKVA